MSKLHFVDVLFYFIIKLSYITLYVSFLHRFDQNKLVVSTIASIIRSSLEKRKPSWKKLTRNKRNDLFDLFKIILLHSTYFLSIITFFLHSTFLINKKKWYG